MLKKSRAILRLTLASRYWHSARIVITNQVRPVEFWEPIGLLLCMATELALKAFALDAGMTEKQLSSRSEMGHDLGKAVLACVKRGLKLSENDAHAVLLMRAGHLEHFYRYGFPERQAGIGTVLLAGEEAMLTSAARLIDIVSENPWMLRKLHERPELDWPETLPVLSPITPNQVVALMDEIEKRADALSNIGTNTARR